MKRPTSRVLFPSRLAASVCTLAVLASTCVLPAATTTWDGGPGGTGTLMNSGTNWTTNATPGSGDTAQWDATVPGDLSLTWDAAWTVPNGANILVTSGHTGSLAMTGNTNMDFNDTFEVQSGAGAVSLGVGSGSFRFIFRGTTAPVFTNNSSNTVTFGSNITGWSNGGGVARYVTFGGSGNWQIDTNYASSADGSGTGGDGLGGGLTKVGTGTLTLNGSQNGKLSTSFASGNTLGSITINEGTLKFGAAAQMASKAESSNAGTPGTYTSTITNNGTFEWASSANQTLSGVISGTGSLRQSGAGTLTLSGTTGSNTYSGGTTITGGMLVVGKANALGATSGSMTINSGTLDLYGNDVTVGSLSGSGGVITSGTAGTITLTSNQSAATTYAGSIQNGSGTVALTKQGAGTLTLSGNNTYTGDTLVSAGTLIVSGTLAGSSVVSGGVLAGTGSLQGVDLASGAISPGTAGTPIGTLNAVSLTLENTPSSFNFDLSASDNTSDRITLTTAFNIGTETYTFNFTGGMDSQTYTLLTFGSKNFSDISQFSSTGVSGSFTVDGSSLTFTTVPEPSTVAMLAGGLLVVMTFRRRSRFF